MSKLKEKSNFNYEAAKELLDKNLFAPSVHCSYYSCFQLLKYTIKHFFDKDYNVQCNERTKAKQKSHQYVIHYISNELVLLANKYDSRDFRRKINDLRNFRNESDYENIEITYQKGIDAFNKADEIRKYIYKNFNL